MANASEALQRAFHQALVADTGLLALLGGARVYDDVPARSEFPYMTFGQSVERDWSTGSDDGSEHTVTLHVWSRARGRKETQAILSAVRRALHDSSLSLDGHLLINLRHEFSEARRDADGETFHGIARFRAVTQEA
jgi:hypothetical protein